MTLAAAGILLILIAGVAAAALPRRARFTDHAYRLLFGSGCVLGAAPAIAVLGGKEIRELRVDAGVPGGPWTFGIDALSAVFVVAVVAVGVSCAVYGTTYLSPERDRHAVGLSHLLVAMLVAALLGVVSSTAVVPFLIAWEVMTVSAYLLVVFDHESAGIRRAGLLYLVASHAALLALFALFASWGIGGRDLTFTSLAARGLTQAAGGAGLLTLALVGFGLKAGIVPLHFWLPEAHAAAPSHVSALMSGVVIKMGIYGLLRVTMLYGTPPAWWGWLILALGVISGILGVIWALAQHDLKRLLAFHSVENIGIILMGMGAGVLGLAYAQPVIAILGFGGAVLHTLNHALFKSLLFLGAGSLASATGTREIDRMGGLARRMPQTATLFFIGSAAIVGLPPLNGFVSEWLVLRSLLQAGQSSGGIRLAILAAAALGLIGALALACFAKVVGVVYLGVARDPKLATASDSPRGMLGPMFALAAACMAIGLLPAVALPAILRVGALLARNPAMGQDVDAAAVPITTFALALAAGLVLAWALHSRLAARRPVVAAETWACGYEAVTPRMQYTASSFATPLLTAYAAVSGVHAERTPVAFATRATEPIYAAFLLPAWRQIHTAAQRLRTIQRGRLSVYLGYIALTLIALLIYLLLAGQAP